MSNSCHFSALKWAWGCPVARNEGGEDRGRQKEGEKIGREFSALSTKQQQLALDKCVLVNLAKRAHIQSGVSGTISSVRWILIVTPNFLFIWRVKIEGKVRNPIP